MTAPPRLVLVGLPGAGKSTAGAGAAQVLGWDFIDLDKLIAAALGKPITEIFSTIGEVRFRDMEREVTRELAEGASKPFVAAPGGGWVTDAESVALLRKPGKLVHLKLSPAEALRRLGTEAGGRPLLQVADPLAEMERLAAARAPFLAVADEVIDVEQLDQQQVISRLVVLASSLGEG